MAATKLLCDTGPLIAFLNRHDQHHRWASAQLLQVFEPLFTCEAVVSEATFLLQDDGLAADPIYEALERRKLVVEFSASDHWVDLRQLIRKYKNLPMSLADASLVRMSELERNCKVLTTDRHFSIYRRNGRDVIPVLAPF